MEAQNKIMQPKYMFIGLTSEKSFGEQKTHSENIGIFLKVVATVLYDLIYGGAKAAWKDGLRNDENPKC